MTLTFPVLIDLQVNGAHGHDLTSNPDTIWDVGAVLPQYGGDRVPSDSGDQPAPRGREGVGRARIRPAARLEGSSAARTSSRGSHAGARPKGAHPEEWLTPPDATSTDQWSRENGVMMVTLAPELPGALPVIASLAERGIVVSIGHTDADASRVAAAVAAGATCVTHLGNAMPLIGPRTPGVAGTALGGDDLVAGVIVDGQHLDPLFVRMAWRCLAPHRFLSVSDTTAALGFPEGLTRLGHRPVAVGQGSVRPTDGTLAGSAASLLDCLRTLVRTVGCSVEEAVGTATAVPVSILGLAPRDDEIAITEDLELLTTVIDSDVVHRSR